MANGRRMSKRLIRFYYTAHTITAIAGAGFLVTALFAQKAEKDTIGYFNLEITSSIVIMYFACSGLLIASVVTGLCAHGFCDKPAYWILYCILMSILVLIEFAGSATALSTANNHKQIETALIDKMEEYNKPRANEVRKSWDYLQITVNLHKCCGVNNYSDWQDVQYGMTSLKVPSSCCLPQFRNNSFCGQNMLPDHEDASSFINTKGCLMEVIGTIDDKLIIMGFFGLSISFPQFILAALSCFLLITKKI